MLKEIGAKAAHKMLVQLTTSYHLLFRDPRVGPDELRLTKQSATKKKQPTKVKNKVKRSFKPGVSNTRPARISKAQKNVIWHNLRAFLIILRPAEHFFFFGIRPSDQF